MSSSSTNVRGRQVLDISMRCITFSLLPAPGCLSSVSLSFASEAYRSKFNYSWLRALHYALG
jgi:hypothetical protein